MAKGVFIAIYGANNVGKSTQTALLASHLIDRGHNTLKLKYPIYPLEPTGPRLNSILRDPKAREGLSEKEIQTIFAQNRKDFQPTLNALLDSGINVVAEDYTGTGIAWGLTNNVSLEVLEKINKDLIIPDIAILIDGKRFKSSIEKKHKNEDVQNEVWVKSREMHLFLAKRYNWKIVNANLAIEDVFKKVLEKVEPLFI